MLDYYKNTLFFTYFTLLQHLSHQSDSNAPSSSFFRLCPCLWNSKCVLNACLRNVMPLSITLSFICSGVNIKDGVNFKPIQAWFRWLWFSYWLWFFDFYILELFTMTLISCFHSHLFVFLKVQFSPYSNLQALWDPNFKQQTFRRPLSECVTQEQSYFKCNIQQENITEVIWVKNNIIPDPGH